LAVEWRTNEKEEQRDSLAAVDLGLRQQARSARPGRQLGRSERRRLRSGDDWRVCVGTAGWQLARPAI
jgi:hypothetical protein